MLKTCQWFLPAGIIYPPFNFHPSGPVNGKSYDTFFSQNFTVNKISITQGIAFFLPFFYTCKVDTYFQKTKMMLYEKM
jgi:hypothetical protein